MKKKTRKMVIAIIAVMALLVSSMFALAATVDGTTTRNTSKEVSINNPPETVSTKYTKGVLGLIDAKLSGSASTTSSSPRYVRVYGVFTGSNELFEKSEASSSGKVSTSGSVNCQGVDQAAGNSYSEVRNGVLSSSSLLQKVTLTVKLG